MNKRDEAAYESLGMLESLFTHGELPAYCLDIAAEILAKAASGRVQDVIEAEARG